MDGYLCTSQDIADVHVASQEAPDPGEISDDQDDFQEFDEEYIR